MKNIALINIIYNKNLFLYYNKKERQIASTKRYTPFKVRFKSAFLFFFYFSCQNFVSAKIYCTKNVLANKKAFNHKAKGKTNQCEQSKKSKI